MTAAPVVDVWAPIGPDGIGADAASATGVLFHIAIPAADANVVYVSSTSSGVWASADRCASWRDATGDLPTLNVVGLAVDDGTPAHVYAALGGDGTYESSDGGASWVRTGAAPDVFPAITELLCESADPRRIYVRCRGGVYGSADGGATWRLVLAGGASHLIAAPAAPGVLYAGMPGQGVVRSADGGSTWTVLTPPTAALDVRVAPSAADDAVIYARYRGSGTSTEIWSSVDAGATWNRVSTTGAYVSVIAADPTSPGRVYIAGASFYRSDDGGVTWTEKPGAHVDHHMAMSDPGRPADLYTACDGGLYRSTAADNWTFVADGLPNVEFYDMAVSATQPDLTIGGTQDNGTLLWQGESPRWREIWGGDGATVAIDPADPQVMYAMNQYAVSIARSDDGGASFANIGSGLPGGSACFNLHFGVHPGDSGVLLACCGSLWRTPVPGIDWTPIFTPPGAPGEVVRCFAITRDDTYYAGTNMGRIYLAEHGDNWQLGFAHPGGAPVADLLVDPDERPSVLYGAFAGGQDRVYRFHATAELLAPRPLAAEPASHLPAELSFGLLRALGGAPGPLTATPMDGATLAPGVSVQTLAADAMRPFRIYAGTNRGVYRAASSDGGATWTWTDYNAGLVRADVRALRVQRSTGVMRAATFGRSAFQVATDYPLGSILNASGQVTFLRVHDVGTGWGSPPNVLEAEVIILLDTVPWMGFGFQLRDDAETATRQQMLSLLRSAFITGTPISIDYVRSAPRAGIVIRVARTTA